MNADASMKICRLIENVPLKAAGCAEWTFSRWRPAAILKFEKAHSFEYVGHLLRYSLQNVTVGRQWPAVSYALPKFQNSRWRLAAILKLLNHIFLNISAIFSDIGFKF